MRVVLVAQTKLELHNDLGQGSSSRFAVEETGYVRHPFNSLVRHADELAEAAGRSCYESYGRPNPVTATNTGYLGHILGVGHYSVLEHASATFYIDGVSRSFLTELERHRHFSYSVLSQRYVDHSEAKAIDPPLFDEKLCDLLRVHQENSQDLYREAVMQLEAKGMKRKEARGAARAFLPEATETKIFLSGNMRTYLEFLPKRMSDGVEEEIKLVAKEILRLLKTKVAPNIFQGLE